MFNKKKFANQIFGIDPGFLALKRSIKTFVVILISVVILWQMPGMTMFAAISAMLFSRSQIGFTIRERRFTMLTTGLLMTLISIPVSLISQNDVVTISFVVIASFVTFFLIGNRVVPDFPAVTILALSVVEIAFSHTFQSGLAYAGLFLMTTSLVYTFHFILWPTRPVKRLKSQIEIIITNINDYHKAIHAQYPDEVSGIHITREKGDKLRKSLGDFRRLWQLFGLTQDSPESLETNYLNLYTGLGKIYEYLILMWQFRVSAWDSEIFNALVIEEKRIKDIIQSLINRHHPNTIRPDDGKQTKLREDIKNIGVEYLNKTKREYNDSSHLSWVSVMNTLKALESLNNDLENPGILRKIEIPEFSVKQIFNAFFSKLKKAVGKLKSSNPAFRHGIRSALIIGSTMAYSLLLKPEYGYWLVLFAVLLIKPNLGISIKVGKQRLAGTVVGSLLALGFVFIVPISTMAYFILLIVSAFLMIWFINLNRMVAMITAMTFMIIGLFYLSNPDSSNLVWLRILYTGAIVLLVVSLSFLLWPEKARKKFAGTLADALVLEQAFFMTINNSVISGQISKLPAAKRQLIRNKIQLLNEVVDGTRNEILQEKVIIHGLNIRSYIMRLLNTLQSLESASGTCEFQRGFGDVKVELTRFSKNVNRAFNVLIEALQNRTEVINFPDLRSEFEILRLQFRKVKYKDGEKRDNLTQYWENSTFIWNLKPLMIELEGIRNEIDMKMNGD